MDKKYKLISGWYINTFKPGAEKPVNPGQFNLSQFYITHRKSFANENFYI